VLTPKCRIGDDITFFGMSIRTHLHVVGRRSSDQIERGGYIGSLTRRTIHLFGDTLASNDGLRQVFRGREYQLKAHSTVGASERLWGDDVESIGLLDAGTSRTVAEALDFTRALDVDSRRRILLLMAHDADGGVARDFVAAGIGDFLRMPAPSSDLLLRVELRFRDADRFAAHRAQHGLHQPRVTAAREALAAASAGVRLSDREYLLFELLTAHGGGVVSRGEILRRIWGRSADAIQRSNIVDVYVRYLRVKLAKVAPDLSIRTVRGAGYSLESATAGERDALQSCDRP
jgi:DNA-binding response OmpR family regulator